MQTTTPTLIIVPDPIETAMGLLRDAGIDFTVVSRLPTSVEPLVEAAAAA